MHLFIYPPEQAEISDSTPACILEEEKQIRNMICLGCTGSLIFIQNCLDPEVAKQLSEATISISNTHMEGELEMGQERSEGGGRRGGREREGGGEGESDHSRPLSCVACFPDTG